MAGGLLARFREGLRKTREGLGQRLGDLLVGRRPEPAILDDLEEALLASDLGPGAVTEMLADLRRGWAPGGDLRAILQAKVQALLESVPGPPAPVEARPVVVLLLGVNGSGKTTTAAKLAWRARQEGERVLLAAADTFRAAAIEQLQEWGQRIGVEVIAHQAGADPSAVVFDALGAARARAIDRLFIDTAGRLHTKRNLMEELKKIHRIIGREMPGAPHETLLVLDATTGLNALAQAREFHQAVGVSGLVVAKLDGTAKGGAVVAIARELKLPVRYLGLGEALEDLEPFDPAAFAAALLA